MTMYISNAFSLNMVNSADLPKVAFKPLTLEEVKTYVPTSVSVVGHADTANVFSDVLGSQVLFNRTSLALKEGDALIVGQYKGPRLEEGATLLPVGATIEWVLATITAPFSWDEVSLDSRDFEDLDISYLWDSHGPVCLAWLAEQVKAKQTEEEVAWTISQFLDTIPSVAYGDSLWVKQGNKWVEIYNNSTTGEEPISSLCLADMYL